MEKDHNLPYFTSLFGPDITDYYGWTIPKANHLLIGAALRSVPVELILLLNGISGMMDMV